MDGPFARYLAGQLHEAAAGRAVERIDVAAGRWQANVLLKHCAGQVLQRVHARGKWLIFDFAHGVTWLCCLVGRAKWTIQPHVSALESQSALKFSHAPQVARAPRARRPVLLEMHFRAGDILQLFGHPILLTLPSEAAMKHPEMVGLGPDIAAENFDVEGVLYRLRQNPQKTVAAALLDQHIISGLGNALKCETLFGARLPPGQKIQALFASDLARIAVHAREAGQRALHDLRAARPVAYEMYDRAGEPCPACETDIQADRSGGDGRWTWHCPVCQQMPAKPGLFG